MKLQFVSYDNIDIIKSNLKSWVDNFKQDSSEWLQEELGNALFSDTKFAEIPDFSLDMTADKPFLTEAENVKRIYGNLRFLSDSQASDERLWAGLCLGPFWDYVKYRWDINKKCTVGNVQQHFFFGFGARRSLTRNALSRLWWIGRLTYDEKRSDPWELTKFVCESSDYIMHILERNTSNNPSIIRPFLGAIIEAKAQGLPIDTNIVGELAKYLNLLGGIYILDCLPEQRIHDKILANDIAPLWTKHPNECEKDDYIGFYRKVFMDYKEPLFWIHLNMDYPFNLKGILYFPKINTEYDSVEGKIKLYNNQVFIADNIKEVIPEFLMVLKGVIDCPDLPLNVSRSALQNDGFVNKISDYISKKVADKLTGMCKTDKESYEKYWDDISPFIKFGCLKDTKFCDKMSDYMLFKNLDQKYLTLKECIENNGDVTEVEEGEEKKPVTIYYVTDEQQQSQYINMFKAEGMDAVILTHNIDSPFITQLEQRNENVRFQRIDADLTDSFKQDVAEEDAESFKTDAQTLTDIFRKALEKETLDVKVEKLKNESVASMMTLSEEARRMQDMMKMYGMPGMDPSMFGGDATLVLNANHPLVQYVLNNKDGEHTALFCKQLYDLALLGNKPLNPEEMTAFINRSNEIMMLLAK